MYKEDDYEGYVVDFYDDETEGVDLMLTQDIDDAIMEHLNEIDMGMHDD